MNPVDSPRRRTHFRLRPLPEPDSVQPDQAATPLRFFSTQSHTRSGGRGRRERFASSSGEGRGRLVVWLGLRPKPRVREGKARNARDRENINTPRSRPALDPKIPRSGEVGLSRRFVWLRVQSLRASPAPPIASVATVFANSSSGPTHGRGWPETRCAARAKLLAARGRFWDNPRPERARPSASRFSLSSLPTSYLLPLTSYL